MWDKGKEIYTNPVVTTFVIVTSGSIEQNKHMYI